MASSVPKKREMVPSSSLWMSCVPQMKRDRGEAEPALVEGPARRRDHGRVRREPEVVVGAEVQDLAPAGADRRALGRLDHALFLVEATLADVGEGLRVD